MVTNPTTQSRPVGSVGDRSADRTTDRAAALREQWQPRAGIIGWLSAVNHKHIGRRYIATRGGKVVVSDETGQVTTLAGGIRASALVVAANGNLYATEPDRSGIRGCSA